MEEKEFYTNVGAFLRRVRKEKGLTFDEIADSIGVNKSFLQNVEAGRGKISLFRLAQVLRCLKVDAVAFDAELNASGFVVDIDPGVRVVRKV